MINIIQNRKYYFIFSGILVGLSLLVFVGWGLKTGLDFTGGSLLEVEFSQTRPEAMEITSKLEGLGLGKVDLQTSGKRGFILRMKPLSEDQHESIMQTLEKEFALGGRITGVSDVNSNKSSKVKVKSLQINSGDNSKLKVIPVEDKVTDSSTQEVQAPSTEGKNKIIQKHFESVGPVIGQELKKRSFSAMGIVLVAIVLYIAWSFRKVSWPVSSWKYGVVAIIALFHDIAIVLGVFVFLGKYFGIEVNTPFVAALLTILGYSVNDTIVVFDRIRENIGKVKGSFEDLVNKSVNETITRSINTSFTTLLVLVAILFFGGNSIRGFILALIIGILAGTYSSIFLASPLLVVWHEKSIKKN